MKYTNTILNFKYKNIPIMIGNLLHFGKWPSHTHTAFALFEDDKGVFVVEASDSIVGNYYEKWWLDLQIEKGKLSVGRVDIDNKLAIEFFKKHEGEPYSYMNLLDIVRYWFLGKTDVLDTKDDWICSEFVAELIRYASKDKIDFVKELKLPKDDFMSPEDFMLSKQIKWL